MRRELADTASATVTIVNADAAAAGATVRFTDLAGNSCNAVVVFNYGANPEPPTQPAPDPGCTPNDVTNNLIRMDGGSKIQSDLVIRLGKMLGKQGRGILNKASEQFITAWATTWAIPLVVYGSCQDTSNCQAQSLVGSTNEYKAAVTELRRLGDKAFRIIKRTRGPRIQLRAELMVKRARRTFNNNISLANQIPTEHLVCQ